VLTEIYSKALYNISLPDFYRASFFQPEHGGTVSLGIQYILSFNQSFIHSFRSFS